MFQAAKRFLKSKKLSRVWLISFILVTALQVFSIVTAQTGYIMWNNSQIVVSYVSTFYSQLMLLTSISISLLAFEAVLKGNEYKYLAFMILSIIGVGRGSYQLLRINYGKLENPIELTILISAIPLFNGFGWKVFSVAGTSPQLKKAFRMYQVYSTLIRFDLETTFILDLIRQNLFNSEIAGSYQHWTSAVFYTLYILSIASAPLTIYYGVRRENKKIQIPYLIFSTLLPLFVFAFLISIWVDDRVLSPQILNWERLETKIVITLLCLAFLLIRTIVIFFGILVMFNFGIGMKEKIYSKDGIFHDYWRSSRSSANFLTTSFTEVDNSYYYEDDEDEKNENPFDSEEAIRFKEDDPLVSLKNE
eukprot:gene12119-5610_t